MADTADSLRLRLDVLNESIYEPEEHMQPSERARRIRERDAVYERLVEIEGGATAAAPATDAASLPEPKR
jgi:hypothetical protein